MRFTRCAAFFVTMIALLLGGPPTAAASDLIFEDGFGSGDLWAWRRAVNGSPGVGPCPCEYEFRGSTFWVDPTVGSDVTGDGSHGNPWASIQHVIDHEVDCTDQYGTPKNPGAPVKAGDRILLVGAMGHGPDLEITGCYNSAWVTISAATPHEPVISSVHFRGGGFWRLDGLRLENDATGVMVRIEDHGYQGPVHHVQVVNSQLTSGDLPTIQDWVDHVSDGIRMSSDSGPITVRCNELTRVAMGFVASGRRIDVINNRVEFFSRDGIATGGHFNRFIGNRIYDSVKLGDGHHDDFFQSHMGANPDTSSDVEITGNLFVNRYTDGQPDDSLGPTQCLSGFEDGPKRRLRITNNLCKADHWHGITWYDTNDSVVVNNTAVGGSDYPGLPPGSDGWPTRTWISIEGTGNIVRNNITTRNLAGGDHNHELLPADVDVYFTDWIALDLTLAPGSPAIDGGNPAMATTHDILGAPRDALPDVGAYEYAGTP